MPDSRGRVVAVWLVAVCVLVYAMIVLGGVTRLTQSGLSMVDWDPVMGVVPPVTESQWLEAFEAYKQFPEYQKVNRGMTLAAFKEIFYVEYAHRMLGRLIGAAFVLPLLVLAVRGYVSRAMVPRLAAMFVLGGLQGLLGWFMVQSGLVDRPSVSQYRLTAHLMLAVVIYAFMLWQALSLWRGTRPVAGGSPAVHRFGWVALGALLVMIASGGFVAGTRAGFVYNTFPLMGDTWVPEGAWSLSPGWLNLFENVITIQLVHRMLAALVVLVVVAFWWWSTRPAASPDARTSGALMLLALAAQVALGIATLVMHVPVALGAAHQAGAVAVLTTVLIHTHCLKYAAGAAVGRQRGAGGRPGLMEGRPQPL